jgi:tRNA G18 (ribose-2'-O)-methylase SpoU
MEDLRHRFAAARTHQDLVVLEGFHTIKHALRFGADVVVIVTGDPDGVTALAGELAPDVTDRVTAATVVPSEVFAALTPAPIPTGIAAIAARPAVQARGVMADPSPAPVVFLERPRHPGNVGAVVRVAAAAGAAGVLTSGDLDPWDPIALRGSAGLHFAVPVARIGRLEPETRPLVALDPAGDPLESATIPDRAVLAFGSERSGLSPEVLALSGTRLRIPMQSGVSSLNLATAVTAVLYGSQASGRR